MPRDGSGTYSLPSPPSPYVPGSLARAEDINLSLNDIAAALTQSLNTAGTAPWGADQNANGHSLTGVNTFSATTLNVSGTSTLGAALTVSGVQKSTGIQYAADSYAHAYQLTWDGSNSHVWVDGTDEGALMTVASMAGYAQLAGAAFTGNVSSTGTIGAATLSAGNVSAGGITVTAGLNAGGLTSNGDLTVKGSIHGGGTSTNLTIDNSADVFINTTNGIFPTGTTQWCGNSAYPWAGIVAAIMTVNTNMFVGSGILPGAPHTGAVGTTGTPFSSVVADTITQLSDPAMKWNMRPLPECTPLLAAIDPMRFRWAEPQDDGIEHWGFSSDAIERAMGAAGHQFGGVSRSEMGIGFLRPSELIAVLWKAVQELSARVAALEDSLTAARG